MEMVHAVEQAEQRLEGIASTTPLQPSHRLSEQYGATILIKREDMQAVRSFKIRGAYNKIASLSAEDRKRPIVCASAGNHAQGVAFACAHLGIGGTIFMPRITQTQKIERVEHFGGEMEVSQSMFYLYLQGKIVSLAEINTFHEVAADRKVWEGPFDLFKKYV